MKRQFHIRPYDPNRVRKPRSAAQEAATARSFLIARLRGLWYLAAVLRPSTRAAVRILIDTDLAALGGETQTARHERIRSGDIIPF
jgi:hypothetical protein